MENSWPEVSSNPPARLIANRYRLGHSLGSGGLGEVFYAEDIKFSPPRKVALKLLHPDFLADAEMLEQIRREADTMAQLNHPNILRVLDFDINPQEAYIVTQYAAGGSLAQKLRPPKAEKSLPFPLAEVDAYLEQICAGLGEAHRQGLVHRDLKPQNILLDENNRPLLADFSLALNIAIVINGTTNNKKRRRAMLVKTEAWGTPEYAAPEVWQGRAGKPSDVYALAALTFELITGSPPFVGNSEDLKRQHNSSPVPPLRRFKIGAYPPELDSVFSTALAKRAEHRPGNAEIFYRQFRQALGKPATTPAKSFWTAIPETNQTFFQKLRRKILNPTSIIYIVFAMVFLVIGFSFAEDYFRDFGVTVLSGTNYDGCISVSGVAWSADGKKVAGSCFGKQVMVWDMQDKSLLRLGGHTEPVHAVAWSPDGRVLASASNDSLVRIWVGDEKGPRLLFGHHSGVNAVAWSPDSKTLASGGNDSQVRLWNAEGGFIKSLYSTNLDWVQGLAWSPDGKILAVAQRNRQVNLWSAEGNLIVTLSGHSAQVNSVAWSAQSKNLATGSDDGTVRVWGSDGRLLNTLTGSKQGINAVTWSPNGKTLAAGGGGGEIQLWGEYGKPLRTINTSFYTIKGLSWSPNGKSLAAACIDNKVRIWSI